MDEHEAAAVEAERKAAALHDVGWETGAGATVWARAAEDVLALHEVARERYAAGTADLETWERLHATALMLVVAVHQVATVERRVRSLTGDADLQRARARFDVVCPDVEALRHLITHFDKYAIGKGNRQLGEPSPPLKEPVTSTFMGWENGGGTIVDLGGESLNLRSAANAATDLAQVVERVRVKHLERFEQEANAARRRQFGLPPES